MHKDQTYPQVNFDIGIEKSLKQNVNTMSQIICQIILALNTLLGVGNHTQQAQQIYSEGAYHIQCGVVIIDTDELQTPELDQQIWI